MTKKFKIEGSIRKFSGKGRELGYPTANIEVDLSTPEGIFVGYTELAGKNLPSLIFIGAPITLGETIKRAESHILGFKDRNLYGKNIKIKIEKKLRNNQKFDNVEELREQMNKDKQQALRYFEEVSSK